MRNVLIVQPVIPIISIGTFWMPGNECWDFDVVVPIKGLRLMMNGDERNCEKVSR